MSLNIEVIDDVLLFFYDTPSFHRVENLQRHFATTYEGTVYFINNFVTVLDKLVKDGFLIAEENAVPRVSSTQLAPDYMMYCISYDGIIFHRNSGYTGFEKRIKENREFEEKKMQLELAHIQSGLDTNSAVQRNITTQEKYSKRTFWMSIASLLFILTTVYFQATDTTAKELRGLQQQLQMSRQSLDSIKLFLKKTNPPM